MQAIVRRVLGVAQRNKDLGLDVCVRTDKETAGLSITLPRQQNPGIAQWRDLRFLFSAHADSLNSLPVSKQDFRLGHQGNCPHKGYLTSARSARSFDRALARRDITVP
jgi:hypothetical protein